jgi:mRNA-degrading endonuclease toxin of MazEF toxin-antitoxin module
MTTGMLRWAMVLVDFDPSQSHEQTGTRRALVVSYEAFHRGGMAQVCPVSAREAKYPGEVALPLGQAGQTRDAVILCHQVRTIDLARVTAYEIGGQVQFLSSPDIRRQVRTALLHQFGLDLPPSVDGVP